MPPSRQRPSDSPPRSAPRKPLPPAIDPATLAPPPHVADLIARWDVRAPEISKKLSRYLSLLLQANEVVNLTSDATPEKQWSAHIEDALSNAAIIESSLGRPTAASRILDIGSGGGVPGIVWAILWPAARVTLLESVRKKADFLSRAIEELRLAKAVAIGLRAEELAVGEVRESFDLVTARAVAPLPTLAELALPFVKRGGTFWAIKGQGAQEELAAAARALKLLGAPNPPERFPYTRSDGRASVALAFRKTAPTPSAYPRRSGVAKTNPL